jgi:hypothetical protein
MYKGKNNLRYDELRKTKDGGIKIKKPLALQRMVLVRKVLL